MEFKFLSSWIESFFKPLYKWFEKKPVSAGSIPLPIEAEETVERYMIDRKWFNSTGVKPAAFLPRLDDNFVFSTSVFRTSKMSSEQVLETRSKFEGLAGRQIKNSALIKVSQVKCLSNVKKANVDDPLSIFPEETQFIWHADIVNWPTEKDERKAIAIELSKKAQLATKVYSSSKK
ncbi:MAG: hypothetical protein ACJA2G_002471 [Cognaticolwellia sp.]|jgi:hypothetical protein